MNPGSARLPVSSTSRAKPIRLLDLGALGAGALVVPEDRRPQHPVGGVEQDEPVHLAGQPDRPVPADRVERRLGRAPPVLGILLGPARLRDRERVLLLGRREHLAGLGDPDRLDAGRPDVEADEAHAPSAAYTSS